MGTPRVHPRLPRVSPHHRRCHASRRFVFRDRPAVAASSNIQQTVCRPSSSPPLLHRRRSAKHTEQSNINIVFSVMYRHCCCVPSVRSVHYANRFPEDTSKGIGRNPSCSARSPPSRHRAARGCPPPPSSHTRAHAQKRGG